MNGDIAKKIAMYKLYEIGYSTSQIAQRYQCTRQWVHKCIKTVLDKELISNTMKKQEERND